MYDGVMRYQIKGSEGKTKKRGTEHGTESVDCGR